MRGSKFLKRIFTLVVIGVLSVATCFVFGKNIDEVSAEDNSIYNRSYASQEYEDGVIFSAEQVYFNKANRTEELYYDGNKPLTNILGYNNTNNYFANYNSDFTSNDFTSANDKRGKKIIYSGDFVLIDDMLPMTAYDANGGQVSLNQGIMLTLGGYIYDGDGEIMYVNSHTDGGSPAKYDKMSKLIYASIKISRNGQEISNSGTDGLSLRTYNSGLYFDFVYFLDCDKINEGYYQVDMTYTLEGQASVSHTFDFYMLLNSSYVDQIEVNGKSYSSYPSFEYVSGTANKYYQLIDNDQMPVLTYDYRHFDLVFNYQINDLVTTVEVVYENNPNQNIERLKFVSTTNNEESVRYYDTIKNGDNNIVSLLLANIGTYQFNFNYVYYYNGERLRVDNLSIDSMELKIHGYEIKYARYGFDSATFKKLVIAQNGTMIVPVGAYSEDEASDLGGIELSYVYELKEDTTNKSGVIEKIDSPKTIVEYNTTNGFSPVPECVNTDQGGVWLELNDSYSLTDSYYIYSKTLFEENVTYAGAKKAFNKDTTFTQLGYYYVCVKYTCDSIKDGSNTEIPQTQYFAFRISSSTPNVQIMTTTSDTIDVKNSDDKRIYSNQYTNKNVYATWNDPTTFESKLQATLYYSANSANPWASKNVLLNYANGVSNAGLTKEIFKNDRLLVNNGSYLLEMSVVGSQTKVYYYFVIDKMDISGIETLGVSSATLGNNLVYSVATDASGKPVTYTNSLAINKNFTMWWDDKASGAKITGSYQFAPIVYSKQSDEQTTIKNNGQEYVYYTADYKMSNRSSNMSIEKPSTQYSVVNTENVLTKQGVYWFYLKDAAGNEMNYMVVLDNTEVKFVATNESGNKLASGETSSESVTIDWGTHKIVKLDLAGLDDFLGENGKKYFKGDKSNYNSIAVMFVENDGKYDLRVANEKMILDCWGDKVTLFGNGTSSMTGGNWSEQLEIKNGHKIVLSPVMQEKSYNLMVFGENQSYSSESNSYFTLVLNKDKSKGKLRTAEDENSDFKYLLNTYNDEYNETKLKLNYATGQATDDGIVVFEWLGGEGTEYEVGEVYYEYYPLMTQEELNNYNKNSADYEFYPYSKTSTKYYIFGGELNAQNYTMEESDGKTVYRSHHINVGRVSYHEGNSIISKNATKPGMYVVTRTYKSEVDVKDDATKRVYVFFVDRNQIIDYSTNETITKKTVGNYIDFFMQDSYSFDSFSTGTSVDNVTIDGQDYNIYLQSNKLPLEIRIPTGKYATNQGGIVKTSNSISGGLKFNLTFVDKYNYLGLGAGASFKLFAMEDLLKSDGNYVSGYIAYKLNTSSLYVGDNNGGNINRYLKACSKVGSQYLSLPGSYIIEILDNVGKEAKANKSYEMEDCNRLYIGVTITQNTPSVDAFAGKDVEGIKNGADIVTNTLNSETTKFDTNKTYVMYELPTPDETKLVAQIDDGYIYVVQKDLQTNEEKVYYNSRTNSGLISSTTTFLSNDTYNYIDKTSAGKTIIWLDTGVTVDGNKVTDYKEYEYRFVVRYKLFQNDQAFYTYNQLDEKNYNVVKATKAYFESNFVINIDRTPILDNLYSIVEENSVMPSQKEFLSDYIQNVTDNVSEFDKEALKGKLNETIFNTTAYRDNNGGVYYAVVNKLYYYLLDRIDSRDQAPLANYAIKINNSQKVNLTLGNMYYRKINDKDLISLLPITSYYSDTGYNRFDIADLSNSGFNLVDVNGNGNWSDICKDDGYYEIVEMDGCGNYTQYVVLFTTDAGNVGAYNSNMIFEPASNTDLNYQANFNFASYDKVLQFEEALELRQVEGSDQKTIKSFVLNSLVSITDIWGNKKANVENNNVVATFDADKDYFYKVVLKYTDNGSPKNETMWTNVTSFNMANWMFEQMKDQTTYELSLTNRFNQSLTFSFGIYQDSEGLKLNLDNFKPKYEAGGLYYYLEPRDLNSNNGDFTFFASEIILQDITNKSEIVYSLNSAGKIISFKKGETTYYYDDNEKVFKAQDGAIDTRSNTIIKLEDAHYYTATITDMMGGVSVKENLYAGESKASYDITFVGPSTSRNNIHYSTDKVVIKYDTNLYTNARIKIYKDGALIFEDTAENISKDDVGKTYIINYGQVTGKTYYTFTICPYPTTKTVSSSGAKIEYVIDYINGSSKAQSNIIIDNRVPNISLTNEDGESKNNIVTVNYVDFSSYSEAHAGATEVSFNAETLFAYTPTLSLSESVYLSWDNMKDFSYSVKDVTYFSNKMFLYSYSSSTEYICQELSGIEVSKWISPSENSIGRYVFVYAVYNNSGKCMMYKAFSFNITSTANAMYEIQDINGEVQEYDTYLKGADFKTVLSGYSTLSGASYWESVKESFGLDEAIFENLNIPIYISNQNLNLVPNGDNGVTAVLYKVKLTSEYTLQFYKVHSNVHTTYVAILKVAEMGNLVLNTSGARFVTGEGEKVQTTNLNGISISVETLGKLYFPSYYKGNMEDKSSGKTLIEKNQLYFEVYYRFSESDMKYVGKIIGEGYDADIDEKQVEFKTAGSYKLYLKDVSGNIHIWGKNTMGENVDYLTLNLLPEVLVSVNGEVPIDYAYYNGEVTVSVGFNNLYDNASTTIKAYKNGSSTEYITSEGGRKTNYLSSFTFTDYGTYKVEINAKRNGRDLKKIIVFSIINPYEARLALDFTAINKYKIQKVVNATTGIDVSEIFSFLLNEGFIYSKLITFERLSKENAFGSTIGKQTFEVVYLVDNDPLVPSRTQSFRFTINNQTPSMQCSLEPGKSTTKDITLKLNPQTIYRQVGDCYIVVNDQVLLTIDEANSQDRTLTLTLTEVDVYYVQIVSDSGRVISSFQVEIKEPLNTWSIVLIVGIILLVVGVITVFIVLRTKMRVR